MQRTQFLQRSGFLAIATLSATLLTPALGLAQAPPTPTAPIAPKVEQLDQAACSSTGTHATVGRGGDVVVRKPDDRTLSSKLAQSEGVICPPRHVDPEIKAPTPPGGAMQVIPPPGSPGGDQSIQPK